MHKVKEYPSFSEIRDDLSTEDLLFIIDRFMDTELTLDEVISEFIEENYPYTWVEDPDAAYDEYKDGLL